MGRKRDDLRLVWISGEDEHWRWCADDEKSTRGHESPAFGMRDDKSALDRMFVLTDRKKCLLGNARI